jgi:fumarate reductase flavoprotein subunit
MTSNDEKKLVSRRNFLKGAGIGVAAASSAGFLAGCGPQAAEPTAEPASGTEAEPAAGNAAVEQASFLTPPDPIPADEIVDTKSADVVILGAGLSGLCAANAAAGQGASVIILEKRETYTFHGMDNGVIGSRLHVAEGVDLPKDQVMADVMRFGGYRQNPRLVSLWANESGRVMDLLLDMADAEGLEYSIDNDIKEHWPYREFASSVQFAPARQGTLIPLLEQNAKDAGVEILYETPAVQLVQDASGKITGVIGEGAEGYIQVDAAKGVIICTGGYGSNKEMLAQYAPRAVNIVNNQYIEQSNMGDGILMGMWVGGAKQDSSCPMLWDGHIPGIGGMHMTLARQPWLYVNVLGERYANEDAPFGYTANQDIKQPTSMKWAVWDAKWETDVMQLHGTVCEAMHPPFWSEDSYQSYMDDGVIVEADTLEGLAEKMEVPVDTFLATVERYNELYELGVDDDFGKDPAKLTSIVEAPFGAAKVGTGILVTCDGLRINTGMQVLTAEGEPIPGLYAAGNASGDFFAQDYPIDVHGLSHGRALTFGWLAGEAVASA